MKLSDCYLVIDEGRVCISRKISNGKTKGTIDVTQEFIDILVANMDNHILKSSSGKVFLTAVREASKEQLVMMEVDNKLKKYSRKLKGEKAFYGMQRMLKTLFAPDTRRMELLGELKKAGAI